jgi:DNA-binding transcriptional LysR family regulator
MNLRLLTALSAVAELGSLTGAARKLGLSAATISERLMALEEELGTKLVVRSGRLMALTSSGNAVVALAREILDQVEELKQIAHPGEISGKLKLGAMSTALTSLLPEALERIATQYPGIELLVVPGTSDVLYSQIEAKAIDCAIVVHPPFAMNKSFKWSFIRDEPIVLVSHVSETSRQPRTALENNKLIRIDRNDWTGKIITSYLHDTKSGAKELFEMNALEAILELVSKGLGVALMPDWGLPVSRYRDVRVLQLPEPGYFRTVGMISPGVSSRAPLVMAIAGILQQIEMERQQAKARVEPLYASA